MRQQTLIVLQGGSAVGKTTLTSKLSVDLKMYALAKDNFKEMLYDTLGIPAAREESTLYGLAATRALYAATQTLLEAGESVIIESAFDKKFALKDIQDALGDRTICLVQLYVTASPEIRLKRYEKRIRNGERHKGHPSTIDVKTVKDFATDHVKYGALEINDTIEVNTDIFTDDDYYELLGSIKQMIGDK